MKDDSQLADLTVLRNGVGLSIESVLLERRIVMFSTEVTRESCNQLQKILLTLDELEYKGKKHQDIYLYIDSFGGSAYALFGIYDAMQHIKSDIVTVCTGVAMSAAAIMLISGAEGKRYALPHSRIMIHEMRAAIQTKPHADYKIDVQESAKISDMVYSIMIKHAKKDKDGNVLGFGGDPYNFDVDVVSHEIMSPEKAKEWIAKWSERDRFMNPRQALNMGFIDNIIETKQMPHYLTEEKKDGQS